MTTEADRIKEQARIKRDLRKTRRKIEGVPALFDEQKRLVLAGDAVGLQPAELARAADPTSGKALRESFGQIIREDRKHKAATRGNRRSAK